MHYKTGSLEATPDVRSVPLGAKRRKGRPKKIPNCLVKSPISVQHHEDTVDETDEEADDEETVVGDAPTDLVVDVGLRTRKRKKPGQNPPKKRQKGEGAVVEGDEEAGVAADAPAGVVVGLGNQKPPKKRAREFLLEHLLLLVLLLLVLFLLVLGLLVQLLLALE